MCTTSSSYNILFLGETQSGKSTLIESLKKYADPDYTINWDRIGDKTFSCTRTVTSSTITTNFPSYFVSRKSERINHGEFINEDLEDYEDELDDRKSYRLELDETRTSNVTFNLIDTPGLNDTSVFDESNIAIILKALETVPTLHLFVITITNNPFTEGLNNSLKAYFNLLQELNGHVVFVHTKIDYARLHPENQYFSEAFWEKKRTLETLMGRSSAPHILIDNDIGTKKVVRDCITQNTLRTLLGMAKLNQPVPLQALVMYKSEKMRMVDDILLAKYTAAIVQSESVIAGNKNSVVARIGELECRISKHEQQLREIEMNLAVYDQDALELLHEELYQQNFSMLNINEGSKSMYYPGKKRASEPGFIHHAIDHIDIRVHNVKILQEAGGRGQLFWAVRFRRRKAQNGFYSARIYIQRRKKFTSEIERWKADQIKHKTILEVCREELLQLDPQEHSRSEVEKALLGDLKKNQYLLGRVSIPFLDRRVLYAMVNDGVFVRDLSESARNVEKFYLDMQSELEAMEKRPEGNEPPTSNSEISEDSGIDVDVTPSANVAEFELFVKRLSRLGDA
ncbi:hypothetical protein BGZ82_009894 [Podila clonocystis]|nr:hypothetical protein BGZ82_009894 [Podila clonocystis]